MNWDFKTTIEFFRESPQSSSEKIKQFAGKLREMMKKVNVEKITIRFRIFYKDEAQPQIIQQEISRSESGTWQFVPRLPSEGKQSASNLKTDFRKIQTAAREYLREHEPTIDWNELVVKAEQYLSAGNTAKDLENSPYGVRGVAGYGYDVQFNAPVIALLFSVEGLQALVQNDLARAMHCSIRGLHWISSDMLIPNPHEEFKARARTGGTGKALKSEPVKNLVAELLHKKSEPWANKTAAIKWVAEHLVNHQSELIEPSGLNEENLVRTIGDWMKVDPDRFPINIGKKPKKILQ